MNPLFCKLFGYWLLCGGAFLAGLQLSVMYPNTNYEAGWDKLAMSFGCALPGIGWIEMAGKAIALKARR